MEILWQDVRYGLRMLAKSPAFTVVAVLALALGIGANTAIFSVIDGMLLQPLPYPDGERIAFISEWSQQVPGMSFSVENFKDLRDRNTVFDSIMAYRSQNYVLTGGDRPERLNGREVTAGIFDTLRIRPLLGRPFTKEEDKGGAERVVLLGESFWTRRFARDPGVLNQKLILNGEPFTVIGVLPGAMHTSMRITDVFTSMMRREDQLGGPNNRGNHPGIYVYARMRPNVSIEQARADVVRIARQLAEEYPNSNARQSMTLVALHDALVEDARPRLLFLLGAVVLVLLIACANVANLLLGRAVGRQREIAVRTALGAGRIRLVRQLLTESVLLSMMGAVLGVLLAIWGVRALVAAFPVNTSLAENISINGTVLGFTALIALVTGLLFGLVPAWQASRTDIHETLKEGGRGGSTGAVHHRVRGTLVVVEAATALILLVGTGLMLKSFWRVLQADPGFNPAGVLIASVAGPDTKYKEPQQRRAFIEQIVNNVKTIPGVQYAASALPLLGGWQSSFSVEGSPEAPAGQMPSADVTRISPDYFRVMDMRLLKGRYFRDQDQADSPKVCIIDETFAREQWPGKDPLGKKVKFGRASNSNPWMEIVGIVNHVKNYGVDQESRVEIYLPYTQNPIPAFTILVRTAGDPSTLTSAVRLAAQNVDADVPIYQPRTLEDIISDRIAERRLAAMLISVFGGLALLLAAVGIYGVMNYSVTQHTHDLGIRMALGAQRGDILRLVIGNGMLLAAIGLVAGFGVAFFGISRVVASVLFRVTATDPPIYVASSIVLILVALLACWIPARRATKVDPVIALRYE
jgi:putative ABC transport system permease protein